MKRSENGNVAKSDIDQENEVEQSQHSYRRQTLVNRPKAMACW
jgi:hypothetical protein